MGRKTRQSRCAHLLGVLLLASSLWTPLCASAASVTLKLAHQWAAPQGDNGDDRSVLADKFAAKVEQLSKGTVKVQVYPGNSLIQPRQQWMALQGGALDMAMIVPSYFSGNVPEFLGLNMMGLLNSHAAANRFADGAGGKAMRDLFDKNGVRVIAMTWGPESVGFRSQKVTTPSGLKGLRMRGPGPAIEKIYANAGAGVVSMPSSDLYSALQTGALDGALTSFTSMRTYRLFENFKYVAASPTHGGLVYALVPLVMSNRSWDKLDDQQKKAITDAAEALKPWIRKRFGEESTRNIAFFKAHGVNVYTLTNDQFKQWMAAAKPIVDHFAQSSDSAAAIVKAARAANAATDGS